MKFEVSIRIEFVFTHNYNRQLSHFDIVFLKSKQKFTFLIRKRFIIVNVLSLYFTLISAISVNKQFYIKKTRIPY